MRRVRLAQVPDEDQGEARWSLSVGAGLLCGPAAAERRALRLYSPITRDRTPYGGALFASYRF